MDIETSELSELNFYIYENKVENGLCLFYESFLSQWHPAKFVIDGIEFKNAEMYMMWAKNAIFDGRLEKEILLAKHPADCKRLGRKIANFNPDIWNKVAKQFVYTGNMAKFTQNKDLCVALMQIRNCDKFVECSPTDTIWGIGLDIKDPRCVDESQWQGTNWLGEVITDVRNSLSDIYYS